MRNTILIANVLSNVNRSNLRDNKVLTQSVQRVKRRPANWKFAHIGVLCGEGLKASRRDALSVEELKF